MVCLGNICINTLHKGAEDNDDDDDDDDDDDYDDDDDDDDDDNNNNNNNNNNGQSILRNMKTWPWILKISGNLKTYLYTPSHLSGVVVTKNFLTYLENVGVTRYLIRVRQKATRLQTCRIVRKFLGHAP
jgi:hypothetical protein